MTDGKASEQQAPAPDRSSRRARANDRAGERAHPPRRQSPAMTLPPELGTAVGFRLRRALGVADTLFTETYGEFAINAAQYALLMAVRHNPGCRTSAAGSLLGITPNNLVPLLDALVARGYVQRTPSTTDRRVRHLRLTPDGEALCVELFERHATLQARIEARMGRDGAAALLKLLTLYSE